MEVISLYDSNGNKLDKTYIRGDKSQKFKKNEHIPIVMIFIENDNGKYLIQKTSKNKGSLYSTTGGHVSENETPDEALIREVKEEIGIDISLNEVEYLGTLLTGTPIRFLYYLKKNIDIDKCSLQEEEVEYIKYMSINEILNLINEELFLESHAICFNKLLEMKGKNE